MELFSTPVQFAAMKNPLSKLVERASTPDQVGPRVTALRECLVLSKAQFADSVGLDRSSLTKIENGDMGLDIAVGERIAQIYGFGLDFIYRGDKDDIPNHLRPQMLVNLFKYTNTR